MKRLFLFFLFLTILSANSAHCAPPDSFEITIKRDILNKNTLEGRIFVNGNEIGKTWERYDRRIAPGRYPGDIRYFSNNEHAIGHFNQMGFIGDFLLEIGEVKWSDGRKRSHLLFHGGNRWDHSEGCIMLGAVQSVKMGLKNVEIPLEGKKFKKHKYRSLPEGHTLSKLRELFYGEDLSRKLNSKDIKFLRPVKNISITIEPFDPSIIGKYQDWGNGSYNSYLNIEIKNNTLSGESRTCDDSNCIDKLKDIKMQSGEIIKFRHGDNWNIARIAGNNLIWKGVGGVIIKTLKHTTTFKYSKLIRKTKKCYKCIVSSGKNWEFAPENEFECNIASDRCIHDILEYSDGKINESKVCINCNL